MIIKHLQDKYVQSAKECILNSFKVEGQLQQKLQIPYQQIYKQKTSFNGLQYKNCLVAIDGNEKVIGVFLGTDLVTLIQKSKLSKSSQAYQFIRKKIMIPSLQRFIKQINVDIIPGLALYGNRFCVDPKYARQGLGTILASQFTKNAKINNYKFTFGITSHAASHKIMVKNNLKLIQRELSQLVFNNKKLTGVSCLFYQQLSKPKL